MVRTLEKTQLFGVVIPWDQGKIIFDSHRWHATEASCLGTKKQRTSAEALEELPLDDIPFSEPRSGCEGPPMGNFSSNINEFVDGFVRCSPERRKPSNRA